MTLKTFVKVLKETPKTLKVVELKKENVKIENPNGFQCNVIPGDIENEKTLTLYKDGENWFSRKSGFYMGYKEWDGTPQLEDHND